MTRINIHPQHPSVIHVDGVDLAYLDAGRGTPVVLIHGSADDFRSWSRQMEPFSRYHRVMAFSRRYHYPNVPPQDGEQYSGLIHVADLAGLICGLGIGPVHLVGSSYGAYVALLTAVHHPELVSSLVLGEPPAMPLLERTAEGASAFRAFTSSVWSVARQAFRCGDTERGVQIFIDGVLGLGSFDRLSHVARGNMLQNAPELRAEVNTDESLLFPRLTCSDVRAVEVPTLLLTGEWSPTLFHLITHELARCLPNAERATILRASHVMHGANPHAYSSEVLTFLAKL